MVHQLRGRIKRKRPGINPKRLPQMKLSLVSNVD